jgi:type IV pilus assembly protein PilW
MNKKKQTYTSAGFTIVELIITMLLAGIISISIFSAYRAQQRSYMVQDQVTEMQQRVRAGFHLMIKEIRVAGYDPQHADVAGITTADPQVLEFTFVADDDGIDNDDADGDGNPNTGADEPNELKTIKFDVYDAYGDGTNDVGRTVGASRMPLIENIEGLEFYYTLEDGTQLTDPTPAQHEDIRTVQINILVRADMPDDEFTNNHTYTLDSGNSWTIGPPGDNFRRRLLTTTVQFRNLGLKLI